MEPIFWTDCSGDTVITEMVGGESYQYYPFGGTYFMNHREQVQGCWQMVCGSDVRPVRCAPVEYTDTGRAPDRSGTGVRGRG